MDVSKRQNLNHTLNPIQLYSADVAVSKGWGAVRERHCGYTIAGKLDWIGHLSATESWVFGMLCSISVVGMSFLYRAGIPYFTLC